MTPQFLVTDTHPLINYWCKRYQRLSTKSKKVLDGAAVTGNTTIYVPAIVLWEISILVNHGRIKLSKPFEKWVKELFSYNTFIPAPFDEEVAIICHKLSFSSDPFDTAIVATALRLDLPLITNDSIIHSAHPCHLYWD